MNYVNLKNIIDYFTEDKFKNTYSIALIGNNSKKDLDITIIDRRENISLSQKLTFLSEWMVPFVAKYARPFIIKHEHRAFLTLSKKFVHLLFYPSYAFLELWETPSFIASLHDTGKFIVGDKSKLELITHNYYERKVTQKYNTTTLHVSKYLDIVLTSYIYSLTHNYIFPSIIFAENLLYSFRYTIIEFINEINRSSNIWHWTDIEKYFVTNDIDYRYIANLLNWYEDGNYNYEDLLKLCADYIILYENKFDFFIANNH